MDKIKIKYEYTFSFDNSDDELQLIGVILSLLHNNKEITKENITDEFYEIEDINKFMDEVNKELIYSLLGISHLNNTPLELKAKEKYKELKEEYIKGKKNE